MKAGNEGHNIIFQAFLKQDQPADSSVAILKWMNSLK